MRFLSLFSGIESASVAWEPLGWECAAVSEIEPFPCALLEYRYPNVPNLGDVTKITEKQIKALGPIDLVVAGWPCTDLSIAGERKGLIDEDGNKTRSGLFFDAVRIINYAKNNNGCRWFVLENVPGLLSSKKGVDFATVLSELTELPIETQKWRNSGYVSNPRSDKWSVAWRILDAQFAGTPQRRRRVFLVGHLGGDGGRAVLLESEGVSGNPAPSRKEKQTVARGIEIGSFGGRFTDIAPTIDARAKDGPRRNQLGGGGSSLHWSPNVSHTIASRTGSGRNGADLDTYVVFHR